MPKVFIHVINIQERIGLGGLSSDSKTNLFGPKMEKPTNIMFEEKTNSTRPLMGYNLAQIRSISSFFKVKFVST